MQRFLQEPSLHNLKGVLEVLSGRYESAEAAFQKAIKLAPRFTGAYVNLGRLYQENPTRRGSVDLCMDFYASPREVRCLAEIGTQAWINVTQYQLARISPLDGGYCGKTAD